MSQENEILAANYHIPILGFVDRFDSVKVCGYYPWSGMGQIQKIAKEQGPEKVAEMH